MKVLVLRKKLRIQILDTLHATDVVACAQSRTYQEPSALPLFVHAPVACRWECAGGTVYIFVYYVLHTIDSVKVSSQ